MQKWKFFQLFFSGNIGQQNVFYDILKRKNALLGYKTRKFYSRKIDFFPKGLTYSFSPQMTIFPTFLVQAIQASNMSFTIFQNEKTPVYAIKTSRSKSQKMVIFPKGLTHGFGLKTAIFKTFFLGNLGQENVFYDILEREKRLSRL